MAGVLLALVAGSATGQTAGPIQTDRPDQTETASLVPSGRLQVEIGHLREKEVRGTAALGGTSVLLRGGITERIELRLGFEWASERAGADLRSGLVPVEVGMKIPLSNEGTWMPAASLVGHMSVPGSGYAHFRTPYAAPSFRFAFQRSLTKDIGLGANLGAEWNGQTARPTFLYTFVLGVALPASLGWFGEVYAYFPQHQEPAHMMDTGLTWLLHTNLQFDMSAGYGLNDHASFGFVSAGCSFRIMD